MPISCTGGVDLPHQVGAARQVDGDAGERLVDRDLRVTEPLDAGAVAPRLGERLPERDADVLDGVVLVDLQVAVGVDGQVEPAVPAELVEHVVEERHAGRHVDLPGPSRSTSTRIAVSLVSRTTVPVRLIGGLRWVRGVVAGRGAVPGRSPVATSSRTSVSAARKASFSAGRADGDAQATRQARLRARSRARARRGRAAGRTGRATAGAEQQEVRGRRPHLDVVAGGRAPRGPGRARRRSGRGGRGTRRSARGRPARRPA